MFNALDYVKRLSDGGFTNEQARNSLEIWIEIMNDGFISRHEFEKFDIRISGQFEVQTSELKRYIDIQISGFRIEIKQEIADVRTELKQEIADLRTELKQEIADLRTEIKQEIANLRTEFTKALHKQTILMGSMFALSTTIITTILGFLLKA